MLSPQWDFLYWQDGIFILNQGPADILHSYLYVSFEPLSPHFQNFWVPFQNFLWWKFWGMNGLFQLKMIHTRHSLTTFLIKASGLGLARNIWLNYEGRRPQFTTRKCLWRVRAPQTRLGPEYLLLGLLVLKYLISVHCTRTCTQTTGNIGNHTHTQHQSTQYSQEYRLSTSSIPYQWYS